MSNDLAGYRRILLFGGSFDPPHRAHVLLPQQVAHAIGEAFWRGISLKSHSRPSGPTEAHCALARRAGPKGSVT